MCLRKFNFVPIKISFVLITLCVFSTKIQFRLFRKSSIEPHSALNDMPMYLLVRFKSKKLNFDRYAKLRAKSLVISIETNEFVFHCCAKNKFKIMSGKLKALSRHTPNQKIAYYDSRFINNNACYLQVVAPSFFCLFILFTDIAGIAIFGD